MVRSRVVEWADGSETLSFVVCPPVPRCDPEPVIVLDGEDAFVDAHVPGTYPVAKGRWDDVDETKAFLIGVIVVAFLVAGFFAYLVNRQTGDDVIKQKVKLEKVRACGRIEVPADRSLCLAAIK